MLKSYHYVWLAGRPDRSEEWLKAKLSEGFDIHHIDGDHWNDAPENLVLIEHVDHMRLHGMKGSLGRLKPRRKSRDGSIEGRVRASRKRLARAMKVYEDSYTRREQAWRDTAKKIAEGL